jgi:WD40 repeat protein
MALSTEESIRETHILGNRDLLRLSLTRKKKDFGGNFKFTDNDSSDGLIECRQFKNTNEILRGENDIGIQAVPIVVEVPIQTRWFGYANSISQTEPLGFDEYERAKFRDNSSSLKIFLEKIEGTVVHTLKQNTTLDIFRGNFEELVEEDVVLGNKSDNTLKEFQSFSDFEYSKETFISCLDWKPDLEIKSGVVAVSMTNQSGINDSRGVFQKAKSSKILLWDFIDPIHPQLVLDCPSDVICFLFNPKKSHIVVGGCINGQLAFWDLETGKKKSTANLQKLKSFVKADPGHAAQKGQNGQNSGHKEEEEQKKSFATYVAASSIEHSHRKPVTAILWIQDVRVTEEGNILKSPGECSQFLSVSADGRLLVWDISHFMKPNSKVSFEERDFQQWRPLYSLPISHPETKEPLDISSVNVQTSSDQNIKISIGTQKGEVLIGQWQNLHRNSSDFNLMEHHHFGQCLAMEHSPFFPEIFVTCGDWIFIVWKEGIKKPLLISPCAPSAINVVRWSPARPSVLFIGTSDGVLDVWDFLDRSHTPILSHRICDQAITSMQFLSLERHVVSASANFPPVDVLLAVGDAAGRLHIVEIPKNLTRKVPKEISLVHNFFFREEQRGQFVEKRMKEAEEKRK